MKKFYFPIPVQKFAKEKICSKIISRKIVIAYERRRHSSNKRGEKKAHPCQLMVLGSI